LIKAGSSPTNQKVLLPGGAGLVGQNLVLLLKERGYKNLVVLDKNRANVKTLQSLHPDIVAECVDLAENGPWVHHFEGADVVVMLQAQIGALERAQFERNNIVTTDLILQLIRQHSVPYTVHVSSSVVRSVADDYYTATKAEQEKMVLASGIDCVVLRPTLMFGWFDRKHLGWLSRFMARAPIFPVPGSGRYMRQPLYVRDFCNIICSCIESRIRGTPYDITGLERVDYIDIIRTIKRVTGSKCMILNIPYGLFAALLRTWAVFDKNPPFTVSQLEALIAKDEFDVIDWEGIFNVKATPFARAVEETFRHPAYSRIALEF
jgi:nucleoside-diphosphate-sugar epimerase